MSAKLADYPIDFVTAADVTKAAGITYRQLDHWVSQGYVRPLGHAHPNTGRPRVYPPHEVEVIKTMASLVVIGGMAPVNAVAAARVVLTGAAFPIGNVVLKRVSP